MYLYIHFPYCLYKCVYCDFNSYAVKSHNIPFKEYSDALKKDFDHKQAFFAENKSPIQTIFFGGGTPSLMPPEMIGDLLSYFRERVKIAADAEITLEANPKTISLEKLKQFKEFGINRVSLGVQNLNEKYLKSFGRIHSASDALEAMDNIAAAGFDNWSVDLIFGFPGETVAEWEETLSRILAYSMPHLSAYAFTVEEEAPYGKMVKEGRAVKPDGDIQDILFWMTRDFVQAAGFNAYEVSNFAKPGHVSRHNCNYWEYGSFMGIGAGAYGQHFVGQEDVFTKRLFNTKLPDRYIGAVLGNEKFYTEEDISLKIAMFEFMMMGLRLKRGVDSLAFENKFGVGLNEVYGAVMTDLQEKALMLPDKPALTAEGLKFLNTVLLKFQDVA